MSSLRNEPPRLIDLQQASREYAISRSTLRRWIRRGRLVAFNPFAARKHLIKRSDLEALIEASRLAPRSRGTGGQ